MAILPRLREELGCARKGILLRDSAICLCAGRDGLIGMIFADLLLTGVKNRHLRMEQFHPRCREVPSKEKRHGAATATSTGSATAAAEAARPATAPAATRSTAKTAGPTTASEATASEATARKGRKGRTR